MEAINTQAGAPESLGEARAHAHSVSAGLNAAFPVLAGCMIVFVAILFVAMSAEATGAGQGELKAIANNSNIFTEENYNLLQWLYRIRRASCARGLRIGFLQPDFLWSIYRPMMRSKKLWRTDHDIKVAVNLWCSNRVAAEERYGHISDWNMSSVTNMNMLFQYRTTFNDDISRWDVSSVTDMSWMFGCAHAFNQAVGNWDVSKVTNMYGMFHNATVFNQPIGDWVVSNVTDMKGMFRGAQSFNQPVGDWDVSKVTDMSAMFDGAESFNQPVGNWDVSEVVDMGYMFCNAHSFNQDLTRWHLWSVRYPGMFEDAHAMQRKNKPVMLR
jgi:surface protein